MEYSSIYQILGITEAEEDNNEESKEQENTEEINNNEEQNNGDEQEDTENEEGEEEGSEDSEFSPEDSSGEDTSSDELSGGLEDDEKPNQNNTDMFFSLSKEEQQLKIKMLKSQFLNLYTSCDDLIDRLNGVETDEDNLEAVSKLSSTLYNAKKYISDYLCHIFPQKSFIENDIMFNRFLDIFTTITMSFNNIVKTKESKENNED